MTCKSLLLSVSLFSVFSTCALATNTEQARALADLETGRESIVRKLMNSQDYTFDLDVDQTAEGITKAVVALSGNERQKDPTDQEKSAIRDEAKYRLRTNLDTLKVTHPRHRHFVLTENKHHDLSVEFDGVPLVYSTNLKRRDLNDSFLPETYRSNFLSKELCDRIRYYAYNCNRNITSEEAQKLNKYLQPLFYVTQVEVMKMLEGRGSLYHCNRWVYSKDRDGIIQSVKDQANHHHALIRKADLKYFDAADVENRIVPQLVDLALTIIPTKLMEIYNDGRNSFRVGKNYKNVPSLIHPLIDNLPYPVLANHRMNAGKVLADMNIPVDYVANQALTNQWSRVEDFVNDDGRIAVEEKRNMIRLLEPVGYLFRNAVRELHILADQYPEKEEAIERLTGLAMTYATTHNIPEDVLNVFYNGRVNLRALLQDLKVKSSRHEGMVADLIPARLRGGLENVRNNLLEALVFHDMVDRFKLFYPYDVPRLG